MAVLKTGESIPPDKKEMSGLFNKPVLNTTRIYFHFGNVSIADAASPLYLAMADVPATVMNRSLIVNAGVHFWLDNTNGGAGRMAFSRLKVWKFDVSDDALTNGDSGKVYYMVKNETQKSLIIDTGAISAIGPAGGVNNTQDFYGQVSLRDQPSLYTAANNVLKAGDLLEVSVLLASTLGATKTVTLIAFVDVKRRAF